MSSKTIVYRFLRSGAYNLRFEDDFPARRGALEPEDYRHRTIGFRVLRRHFEIPSSCPNPRRKP